MQQEQFENLFARQVITHPFSMMANMVSLFHTGVPAKIPDLKFVYTEAGVAWVPFMMWRLDRYAAEHRRTVPFLEDRPSDYLKRSMWFATQPLEEPENWSHLAETIHQIGGAERVMFASDWPHHDFDHPRAIDKLPLKPDEKHLILSGNATEAFNLPDIKLRQLSKTA
jgi:predicted TIM-barrel fold metal-dependent hydrolase